MGAAGALLHAFLPQKGWIAHITDVLFFLGLSLLFLCAAYRFRFPEFRPYLGGCVLGGFFLVKKILSQSVAIRKKMWYNKNAKRKKSVKTDRSKL